MSSVSSEPSILLACLPTSLLGTCTSLAPSKLPRGVLAFSIRICHKIWIYARATWRAGVPVGFPLNQPSKRHTHTHTHRSRYGVGDLLEKHGPGQWKKSNLNQCRGEDVFFHPRKLQEGNLPPKGRVFGTLPGVFALVSKPTLDRQTHLMSCRFWDGGLPRGFPRKKQQTNGGEVPSFMRVVIA